VIVSCDLGTVPSGATATVTLVAYPTNSGAVINIATVASTTVDPSALDDQDTSLLGVQAFSGPNYFACTIVGTMASETLTGTVGPDVICGLGGDDTINGNSGIDVIIGGPGDDQLHGNNGNDRLFGGPGADVLQGNAGLDGVGYQDSPAGVTIDLEAAPQTTQDGFGAQDTVDTVENLTGSRLDDTMAGNDVKNIVNGSGGNDSLTGRGGNDYLYGDSGDDALWGGDGNDRLDGGPQSVADSCDGGATSGDVGVRCEIGTAIP
jgi:Ca2+-binding RTX toxin-like protein